MKFFRSKLGLIFSLSYLAIFLFSGIYGCYLLISEPMNEMAVWLPCALLNASILYFFGKVFDNAIKREHLKIR